MGPAMSVPFQASHGYGGRGEKRPSDPKNLQLLKVNHSKVLEKMIGPVGDSFPVW